MDRLKRRFSKQKEDHPTKETQTERTAQSSTTSVTSSSIRTSGPFHSTAPTNTTPGAYSEPATMSSPPLQPRPTSRTSSVPPTLPKTSRTLPPISSPLSNMAVPHALIPQNSKSQPLRDSGVEAQVNESLTMLRQVIANGRMSLEEEIGAREAMAELSQMIFEGTKDINRFNDAMQNFQAILRLLTTPSARRAKFLDKLAFLEMSAFGITNSKKTLDDSIAHSQQARDEALPTNDPLLPTIYHNLGYSISHRGLATRNDKDMEEAIDAGRQVLRLAQPGSEKYQLSMVNLASRLQTRYKLHRRQEDLEEALGILDLQLREFPPGSHQHGAALLVKSRIFFERHDESNDPKDIEEAILYAEQGLGAVPAGHERQAEILLLLTTLYKRRHAHTKAVSDLENAVNYSRKRLATIPETFGIWADVVAEFLHTCAEYAIVLTTVAPLMAIMQEAQDYRARISKKHAKRQSCNLSLAAMLSHKYILSRDGASLVAFIAHVLNSSYEHNDNIDLTQQKAATDAMYDFASDVRKLATAPDDKAVKSQALEQLYQFQLSRHQSKQFMIIATKRHAKLIKVLAKNLDSPERLSLSQIEVEITELENVQAREAAESRQRAERMNAAQREDHIDPVFGHRNLALSPNTGRIVLDMETLVREMLGWGVDEADPVSWEEFQARENRLERESFSRETQQGKHPNPSLCRMCRIAKPLEPMEGGGWTWNKKMWIPFGTHGQLMTRKHCSICRLILSLITTDGDQLHPRLVRIDREIQGTQFHLQRLPDGELMLGVEYGMIYVGALRMLKPSNVATTMRQNPEHLMELVSRNPTLSGTQILHMTTGDQMVNFEQLRGWIYACHSNHGELCNIIESGPRYTTDIPLYLVDVQRNCLVAANSAERYFTLSYVWGKVKIDKTIKANLLTRMQSGGLDPQSLPATIRDAIAVVKGMGEHYLWTDALCIVQDDLQQTTRDIPRMDIVYKKGFANLVALAGTDANAGLPGISINSRPKQQVETFSLTSGSQDLALREDNSSMRDVLHLVASPVPLSFAQEASKWITRAWILQEQVLARRNLYFSSDYVYFKCNEHTQSEAVLEGKPTSMFGDTEAHAPEEDTRWKVMEKLEITNPLVDLRQIVDVSKEEHLKRAFKAYTDLVDTYTTRDLTHETDILNAFSGMLSAFTEVFQSKNFCGLPIAALDMALLWTPAETLTPRKTTTPAEPSSSPSSEPLPDVGQVASISEAGFPTWSWAGWTGHIDYRLFATEKEPAPEPLIGEFFVVQDSKILRLLGYQRACADVSAKATSNDLAIHFTQDQMAKCATQPPTILHMIAPGIVMHGLTVNRDRTPDYLSSVTHIHTQTKQAVTRLQDKNGKHCGILFEHIDYHHLLARVSGQIKTNLEHLQILSNKVLIALSETKDVYGDRSGLHRVEGDIEIFDKREYPAQGPGSALVNVLVLSLGTQDMFERLAVGQIHVKAWQAENPRRMWVKLA